MIIHLAKEIEDGRLLQVKRMITLSMTLSFLSEIVGLVSLGSLLSVLVMIVFWSAYYALIYRAFKKMLYSFLTFVLIVTVAHTFFCVLSVVNNEVLSAAISGLNALVGITILLYVNRPIFFPKINWTEYDFRHRKDKRINIILGEGRSEIARLYDQRRGEAAVICITDLEIGANYKIEDVTGEYVGTAKVMSQRKTLLGRPTTHGVRMVNNEV